MKVAIGNTALHLAQHHCIPTLEGIEIQWTAGFGLGGTEMSGMIILDHHEAIRLAAMVEDILDKAAENHENGGPTAFDELDHMSAQVRKEME